MSTEPLRPLDVVEAPEVVVRRPTAGSTRSSARGCSPGRSGSTAGRGAGPGSHPASRRRRAPAGRSPRPVPAVLRARPRSDQALATLAAARRQVPGVRRPGGRPPPHPDHPCRRGGAGRHRHRPGRQPLPAAHRGDRARARLRARSGGPRLGGGVLAVPPGTGYDHAVYGADVTLAELNLCLETLDGVRNHSWRRPPPATPEGEVVAWADRIAYVCHDFEDAVRAGILVPDDLPAPVREVVGAHSSEQIGTFVLAVLEAIERTGHVGMTEPAACALAEFRDFNFERIYLRPASRKQAERAIRLLPRPGRPLRRRAAPSARRRGRRPGARARIRRRRGGRRPVRRRG